MVTFILCVKHYENCYSYEKTWNLLKATLVSICNQTSDNYNIIVVSNKTLDTFNTCELIRNVSFFEVGWEPPTSQDQWQINEHTEPKTGMSHIQLDRGTKYILGLSQVTTHQPGKDHYVMFVDADDFIHKNLVEYILDSNADYLRISTGIQLFPRSKFTYIKNFSGRCGTSNITKLKLLTDPIDFTGIHINSNQKQIIKTTDDYYRDKIIGSHRWSFDYFKKKGYIGKTIPAKYPAAIYNCSHNEQHSGGRGRSKVEPEHVLTDSIIEDYGLSI